MNLFDCKTCFPATVRMVAVIHILGMCTPAKVMRIYARRIMARMKAEQFRLIGPSKQGKRNTVHSQLFRLPICDPVSLAVAFFVKPSNPVNAFVFGGGCVNDTKPAKGTSLTKQFFCHVVPASEVVKHPHCSGDKQEKKDVYSHHDLIRAGVGLSLAGCFLRQPASDCLTLVFHNVAECDHRCLENRN